MGKKKKATAKGVRKKSTDLARAAAKATKGRTPLGSRIGTKAEKIDKLLISNAKAGVTYTSFKDYEEFVKKLGFKESTVGCHIFNLTKNQADKLKKLGVTPPSYKRPSAQ